MRRSIRDLVVLLGLLCASLPVVAQQTVGLFVNEPGSFPGYTLFPRLNGTDTFLIDHDGKSVHQWSSSFVTGNTVYLLPDGNLLRALRFAPPAIPRFNAGGAGGRVEILDWDGSVVWDYIYSSDTFRQHHDVAPMPDGNVLLIAWELRTAGESIQAGRNPALLADAELWPEHIVEVQPSGTTGGIIVWEWHLWDHLIQDFDPTKDNFGVIADHPELVDVNYTVGGAASADWLHANAIDYNPELDQILLGVPFIDEIWIIDHSTTTAQAAGHTGGNSGKGGDLLYRWGNPEAYGRGLPADKTLFNQHDAEWIDAGLPGAGNLLVFNNGNDRPGGPFSTVDEIVTTVDVNGDYPAPLPGAAYGPAGPVWSYVADPPGSFNAGFLSSAERQPNGTTLIDEGPIGNFFEVEADSDIVWKYVNPVSAGGPIMQGSPAVGNNVFRAERYAADYTGLIGRDLTPGDPLELFTPPVEAPDGSGVGAPLTARRLTFSGDEISVRWDASCSSFDYALLYGELAGVSDYDLIGAECSIGTGGLYSWLDVPGTSLYFVVVGIDDTGVYESSWGRDSANQQRNKTKPSWTCDVTSKVVSQDCP